MWNDGFNKEIMNTVQAAERYIRRKRISDEKGVRWSILDAEEGKHFCNDEISLYSGSAGIGKFLIRLGLSAGETELLRDAVSAADYMIFRWENDRKLGQNFSPYAYTTGYSGVAEYLISIYELTGEAGYRDCAEQIIGTCISEAKQNDSGQGWYWSDYDGIVGNAGTILFLLSAAERFKRDDWKRFAIQAGKYYIGKSITYGKGRYYKGVDPAYFGYGNDLIDPNYPMGTAGIGFLLLKLYEASGEACFLDAEEAIPAFLSETAVRQSQGILLPHSLPYNPGLFYLGYCHGPAGTIRYLYQGYRIRKDERYRLLAEKLLRGLIAQGAPAKMSSGYWNVFNYCCGTSGILNLFLGLLADLTFEIAERKLLKEKAEACVGILLEKAEFRKEGGVQYAFWRQALDRVTPDRLSGAIGYYDGAAGIGDMLLSLHQADRMTVQRSRALDDPFPECLDISR